jgi:TonB family protein
MRALLRVALPAALIALALTACDDNPPRPARVDTTLPDAPAAQAAVGDAAQTVDEAAGAETTAADASAETQLPETTPEVEAAEPQEPVRAAAQVITQPDWMRRPSAEDLARYYPDRASRMSIEGTAIISCSVDGRGLLEDCSVVSENPPEAGFGDATLKASKLFRMRPLTKDGASVEGGTVRIPLRWVLPRG